MTIPFLPIGVKNANNRVYTQEAVAKAVADLAGKTLDGTMGLPPPWGDCEHPGANSAFMAKNVRIVHDSVAADIEVLDTPKGKMLMDLMSKPGWESAISFSPVGEGQVNEKGEVYDYSLTSIAVIPTAENAFNATNP